MDFTTPTAPVMLATLPSYAQQGYNHSCWMDEEGEYLVMCDETRDKSCKVVDVRNLGNVNIASMFRSSLLFPDTTSIPHNPLVVGDYVAVAYYHDGVQIWDISNRTAPVHVAGYDTQPNNTTYNDWYGAWGTYPFLPSGTVLGSDVHNGLFVFRVPFPFPRPITATINTTPSSCSSTANGHGQIIPSGGTGPYTYQWSSGQTTAYVTNLLPGSYTVTISDRYGYNIVETVNIPGPAPILVTAQVAAESCNGTGDAAIDLHTSGGTPGYSFLWSTGDMVEDLNGLTAGTYSVTVTDSLGCVTVQSVNVSYLQPSPPAFAGNDTTLCNRNMVLIAQPPTQGVGNWAWISGSGNIVNPSLPSTLLSNLQQGLNQLTWIVFNGQCSGIDTIDIYVSSTAFIFAGTDTVVCGPTLQLSGSSQGAGQGMWTSQPSTVAFNNANDPNTQAAGLQPGQYTLFWSVSEGNCQAIDSISVFVSRLPFAVFSFVPTGMSVSFSDMSQFATQWAWTFGDGGTSTQQNPVHVYAQPGVYNVCLIVRDTCGADTTCQAVTVGTVATTGPASITVDAWPNPFGAWLGISATAPASGPMSIQILDLQGRAVWHSTVALLQGNNEFRLELPGLAAGMYILDLQASDWSRKIPLVRQN
jgi:PKD repeat protein